MQSRIEYLLETQNKLNSCQFGFRPGRSTDDVLLNITQIKESLNNKKSSCVVYVDLKGAFDRVWRHGLLYKAAKLGITGNILRWLSNYLEERTQSVVIHGHVSQKVNAECGVPQGAILSPILFNIMMHDIPSNENIEIFVFADDITLICTGRETDDIQDKMQSYIDQLHEWFNHWGFLVNSTKTKMQFFTRRRILTPQIYYDGQLLESIKEQRLLGVILDSPYLTWKAHAAHISLLVANCTKRIGIMKSLSSISYGASHKILRNFYIAYIRSRLTYCSSAFVNASKTQMKRLEVIQNTCLRLITGGRKTTPILSLEAESHIPPLNIYIIYGA